MELEKATENKIKEIALLHMSQARPDRDVPHLHAVVYYMKELLKGEGGNEKILLPAIYFHDIGYAGLLEKGYSYEDNQKVKPKHMEVGAQMARTHLEEIGGFAPDEIDEISRLVLIHDNLSKINDKNSQMVFEADSLGQIDVDRVKPNFSEEDFNYWLNQIFKEERVPLFKTKTGKQYLQKLLPEAENYFK